MEVLYAGGTYSDLYDCDAALEEIEESPYFASGWCYESGGKFTLH